VQAAERLEADHASRPEVEDRLIQRDDEPLFDDLPHVDAEAQTRVVLVVLVSSVFGLVYFVKALTRLNDVATANDTLSFSDREIAAGNSIVVDQQAAYQARALIPHSESYRVVTGETVKDATPLTLPFVESWYRYFLMPRRPAADARWIVCYACDVSKLGGPYSVIWRDKNGISIGRLR